MSEDIAVQGQNLCATHGWQTFRKGRCPKCPGIVTFTMANVLPDKPSVTLEGDNTFKINEPGHYSVNIDAPPNSPPKEYKIIVCVPEGDYRMAQQKKTSPNNPWVIGTAYFIRTVTHHYSGRLEAVYQKELVLSECAWIADDGRFHTALSTGELNEVEPFPGNAIIGRGSIVDASVWTHPLPRKQK